MAARKDYYAALGVEKGAPADEIKRAYRRLARKWHPDVNPGDTNAEERFKEISEAYHVLGDDKRRKQYDQIGPDAFAQDFDMSDFTSHFGNLFRGGVGAPGAPRASGDFGMFEEILGGLGGFGQQSAPRQRRGRDVQVPLQLTLAEAGAGVERTVAYRAAAGSAKSKVRIPAGVENGARVRVRGKGESIGAGGAPGDLILQISVTKDPRFRRDGQTLRTEVPITIYEAILGGPIDIPTLVGDATINLPPGTQTGQVFRLRGKGLGPDGSKGDLLAKVSIQTPHEITAEINEVMEEYRESHPYEPRRDTKVDS
ncbi:MAG: DnaJ domain-containing protein [Acidobacteria bacterium]|nr:DnaJ domain-containing protein [Acidobacteriota bacterium]